MKTVFSIFFAACFLLAGPNLLAQKKGSTISSSTIKAPISKEKAKALAFGQELIKAYFDGNCQLVANSLASEVIAMESGQHFSITPQLKSDFCDDNPIRSDIQVSYQMYLDSYKSEVMDKEEFAAKYPQRQQMYNLQAGDIFFNGANLLPKKQALFSASDMAMFILRPTANGFEIIAI